LYIYANNEPLQNRFDDEKELIATVESIVFGEELKTIQFDAKLMVDLRVKGKEGRQTGLGTLILSRNLRFSCTFT
jgi:hypothetical protein